MLLQFNLNNSKIGQTNVNVIYSKNHNLSKVTIINGTRFVINYPYNLTNNLSSNMMVVQRIKFNEPLKNKSKQKTFENPKSVELNVRKVRMLSTSNEKKIKEKAKNENNKANTNFKHTKTNITEQNALDTMRKKMVDERINLAKRIIEEKNNLELDIINGKKIHF